MMHSIRDILIYLFYLTGITYIYKKRKARYGPLVRIVVFHDVADQVWFDKVLSTLSRHFNLITTEQFHSRDLHQSKINVLISFDDGYQSWVEHCMPVMDKYHCKGLFFVNSGLLDIAGDEKSVADYMQQKLKISPVNPLDWEGAKKLLSTGHTIGGHTINHSSLGYLNLDEVKHEVIDDKLRIEHQLAIKANDFAYPFGTFQDYSDDTLSITDKTGYQYQYSVNSDFVQVSGQRTQLIPRTLLEKNHNVNSLPHWISGGYDVFNMLRKML